MSVQKTILRLSAIYAFSASFLAIAPSALAASFFPSADNKSVFVTSGGVGRAFDINFDGNVNGTQITGLSSTATFKYVDLKHIVVNSQNITEATFEITLKNTSTGGITSRTSALGFDVDPNLRGVGSTNGTGNTRVSGIFNTDNTGNFPNGFGNLEVCFFQTNGNGSNCAGGGNGGVSTTDTPGVFNAVLAFTGKVYNFTLSNFGVRYQSITGVRQGNSGTGKGFFKARPRPKRVFEPGTTSALGLFTLGAFLAKKKKRLSSI